LVLLLLQQALGLLALALLLGRPRLACVAAQGRHGIARFVGHWFCFAHG
jgi:hypothetical protein